jgi:Fe-coproporphyrin III synthase
MCDIWRIRQVREISARDLEAQLDSLLELRVRWVVFSGGEPQMNKDLAALSHLLRREGIRVTLLTAGLLLERNARSVADTLDDIIVSLDGPPEVHDLVRRVPGAFERLARGVAAIRGLRPEMPVSGRCTVQKANFGHLRRTVQTAKQLQLNSISFLAADVTSEAFNRPGSWPPERQSSVALDYSEVVQLGGEIEAVIRDCAEEIGARFIAENPEKLRRILNHFLARLGKAPAVAPRCNAPWVSSVIEADGSVRPCFFHPAHGNIRQASLVEILNGPAALEFRRRLDVASNPICRTCVCSLYLPPERIAALQTKRADRNYQ